MTLDPQTAQIALDALWNRLHHQAWETHRVTHSIGNHNPKNPYIPQPRLATIAKCKALDTTDTIHESARILTTAWPEEHPHLAQALAIELDAGTYAGWALQLRADFATFQAAVETWPHAYEYKTNLLGTPNPRDPHKGTRPNVGGGILPSYRPHHPARIARALAALAESRPDPATYARERARILEANQ